MTKRKKKIYISQQEQSGHIIQPRKCPEMQDFCWGAESPLTYFFFSGAFGKKQQIVCGSTLNSHQLLQISPFLRPRLSPFLLGHPPSGNPSRTSAPKIHPQNHRVPPYLKAWTQTNIWRLGAPKFRRVLRQDNRSTHPNVRIVLRRLAHLLFSNALL